VAAHSEDFVILACTVSIQFTSVTDRRTDGRTDGRTDRRCQRRAKHSAFARKNSAKSNSTTNNLTRYIMSYNGNLKPNVKFCTATPLHTFCLSLMEPLPRTIILQPVSFSSCLAVRPRGPSIRPTKLNCHVHRITLLADYSNIKL